MKTIIYIRTSTTEQNPENQLKDCLSIHKQEYGAYEVIRDEQSAWKDNKERKGFDKLCFDIKHKKFEHLIVWDLDRIYRNRKNLKDFFEICKVYNIKIHSFRQEWLENINSIPNPWNEIVSDMMIHLLGWIAQDESDKKSQRVKASIRIKDGEKYSYKGNKWGHPTISTFKRNKLKELIEQNPNIKIRQLSDALNLSVGAVHKYIHIIKNEKPVV